MKIKNIILVAIPALILSSCGGSVENTPEAVTKAFAKAMAENDFGTAKDLCTKESKKDLEMLEQMMSKMPSGSAPSKKVEKEEAKCETEGDNATCTFCCIEGEGEKPFELVKEDGNWKVKFSKTGGAGAGENAGDAVESAGDAVEDAGEAVEEAGEAVEEATEGTEE